MKRLNIGSKGRLAAFLLCFVAGQQAFAIGEDGDSRVYGSNSDIVVNPDVFKDDGSVDFEVLDQKYKLTEEDDIYIILSKKMQHRIQVEGVSADIAYEQYLSDVAAWKARRNKTTPPSQLNGTLNERVAKNAMRSDEKKRLLAAIVATKNAQKEAFDPNGIAMKQAQATLALDTFAQAGMVDEAGRPTENAMGENGVPVPDDLRGVAQKNLEDAKSVYGYEMVIFISQSMPKFEILQALELAKASRGAVALRGVKEGQKIDDVSAWFFKNVSAELRDSMPNLIINPVLFKDAEIELVPAIGFRTKKADPTEAGSKDRWIAVQGTLSPEYVLRFIDTEAPKTVGPTYQIVEIDMIDHFKVKMEKYDWEKDKKAAVSKFWNRMPKFDLQTSRKDSVQVIDPTVIAPENVPGAYGETILAKGTRINPLDYAPMTKTMVVFNAMKNYEIEAVKKYVRSEVRAGKTPESFVFMTTDMDRADGKRWWGKYFGTLYEITGKPVAAYFFQRNLQTRFGLTQTPSIIFAKDKNIVIRTLGIDDETIKADEAKRNRQLTGGDQGVKTTGISRNAQ